MTTVVLTRQFSGFTNIDDNWVIGEDDNKAGTIGTYELPDGYYVGENMGGETFIFDHTDFRCEIHTHKTSGRPQLVSGLDNSPVLKAIEVVG